MTARYTAIGEAIPALVTAITSALDIPVYDGGTDFIPSDTSYVIIGGIENDPAQPDSEMAEMVQEWHGLGAKGKLEEMMIHCLAVGRASRANAARTLALQIVEDVAAAVPEKPSTHTYNAMLSSVDRIEKGNAQSGATVHVIFTISVKGRLVPSED